MAPTESGLAPRGILNSNDRAPTSGALRARLMAIDTIAVGLGLSAASAIRSPGDNPAAAMASMVIAYSVWIAGARLYRSRLLTRRTDEIRLIVNAAIRTGATVGFSSFVFDLSLDRLWLAIAILPR